eukprot:91133-Prymnesium_polylepis.1
MPRGRRGNCRTPGRADTNASVRWVPAALWLRRAVGRRAVELHDPRASAAASARAVRGRTSAAQERFEARIGRRAGRRQHDGGA